MTQWKIRAYGIAYNPATETGEVQLDLDNDPKADLKIPITSSGQLAALAAALNTAAPGVTPTWGSDGVIRTGRVPT